MQLHSLINRVVDGKLMQRDAIHQLLMAKINQPVPAPVVEAKEVPKVETPVKKSLPLADFVEKRKNKLAKKEYSVELAKGETKDCPDCGQTIFNGSGISSCLCFGESKKVYLKKTEDGIKVSFGPKWDVENIEMLLEILRNKK
jgi:hypothetical protein